jgi:hypothetical protein
MTLQELVQAIAATEGIDRQRVAAIARAVREAGLIATHGRGTSAARMTESDAANLIIAVNVAETARSAPEAVRRYRALRAKNTARSKFGVVLEEMISAAARRNLAAYLLNLGFGPAQKHNEQFGDGAVAVRIEFRRGWPPAVIECRIPSIAMPQAMPFYPLRRDRAARAEADRGTTISERTIVAVANKLRHQGRAYRRPLTAVSAKVSGRHN